MEAETLALAHEIDFSMWALFARATLTVKIVMIMLIVASFWAWSIIVQKMISYRNARTKALAFDQKFWSGEPLDALFDQIGPAPNGHSEKVFVAGMTEWRRGKDLARSETLAVSARDRIDRVMNVTVARELETAERNLGVLATIGSAAPFVGLFGTVWGIMTAFQAIAATKDTNLAVVAPGIAEALFATALGLLAAIPAVVGYNRYSAAINSYAVRLEGFTNEFAAILSRQLDEGTK